MAQHVSAARAFGAALIVLATVSACTSSSEPAAVEPSTSPPSPSASADPAEQPEGTLVTDPELLFATWRAAELYGSAVDPNLRAGGRHLNLTFEESDGKGRTWTSTDLCNDFGGRYSIDDSGTFETRSQWSTLVACIPGSRVGERNIEALTDADQAWLDDDQDRLTLSVRGEPVAVYARL